MKTIIIISIILISLVVSTPLTTGETINYYIQIDVDKISPPIENISYQPIMPYYKIPLPYDLQKYTWEISEQYDFSYELILAIMQVESKFDIKAISYNDTSLGLMQLNKNTYPWIAEKLEIEDFNVFKAKHNIHAAIWYLDYIRNYWRQYDFSEEELFNMVLLSYNRGIAGSREYMKKHGTDAKYVEMVYDYKTKLEKGEEI